MAKNKIIKFKKKLFFIKTYRKGHSTKNTNGCEPKKLTSVISDLKRLSFEKCRDPMPK